MTFPAFLKGLEPKRQAGWRSGFRSDTVGMLHLAAVSVRMCVCVCVCVCERERQRERETEREREGKRETEDVCVHPHA